MPSIQALREQRNDLAKEARQLHDSVKPEEWKKEHDEKYTAIVDKIDSLDSAIKRHDEVMAMEAANAQRVDRRAENDGTTPRAAADRIEMEKGVFNSWLRGGVDALNSDQRAFVEKRKAEIMNTMSTTTPAEGGYIVPKDFASTLIQELKAFGGMRAVANVISTVSGNEFEWPTTDPTSEEGEIVSQNAAVSDEDFTFGVKSLGAYKYSSKAVAVPFELLQDSAIDLEAHIIQRLAQRIARITNKHFTIGTAINQPNGVVPASAAGKVGANGQTTSITYDDLVDLEHAVDPDYRQMDEVAWMFHDNTLRDLKKLKDNDGRPIWLPDVAGSAPARLLNYRYSINQHMPVMEASAKSVLFGAFGNYTIRDVMDVTMFRMTDSAYTKKGQVGFLAFSRHDGDLMDASGATIKHYQNAAS